METAEYTNINTNEDDHFYYVAVHALMLAFIKKAIGSSSKTLVEILDAGCGTGWLAKKMERFGHVRAIDMHDEAIRFAKQRGVEVQQASIEKLPFEDNTFDLVTSVDVIYHKAVKNDLAAVQQIFRVLKPGGHLIIRVPAEPMLHSSHDEFVHTARRYTKSQFQKLLQKSGFKIDQITYCQSPLFIPAFLKARMDKQTNQEHNSVIEHQSRWLNESLKMVLHAENEYILAGGFVPKGIGLIATCRKI